MENWGVIKKVHFSWTLKNKSYFATWSGGVGKLVSRRGDATCAKAQKHERSWPIREQKAWCWRGRWWKNRELEVEPFWVICALFNFYLEELLVFWLTMSLIFTSMGFAAYLDIWMLWKWEYCCVQTTMKTNYHITTCNSVGGGGNAWISLKRPKLGTLWS